MDPWGNLWLPTGDNISPGGSNGNPTNDAAPHTDVRATSGNTNDYRGKVLRITPIPFPDSENPAPGLGSTYNIPDGNLFDKSEPLAKPEVYTMGHRNPFTISIHPTKMWLAEGEYTGNAGISTGEDEINVFTGPANNGWPWFSGNDMPYAEDYETHNIKNTSPWNTGLTDIPLSVPAAFSPVSTDITMDLPCGGHVGPWMQYNPYSNSIVKFPPYMHDKLVVTDITQNYTISQ